ncbi:twin-arginine translocase subunit TatC [Actinocrinis puniceicyclus]|uniref:Sec-independent protein translocase protein TatC n=1 Tax=Actinocrinis puniceicyclus TaxID=977794 RepID=A0A8J7WLE1_9ACTN|nr:twin-arginine translocase subunit TatC [Actinocrinis puniceicyclus]MBS2961639.1 twin-arginine translocase subunit TatC [Actinocrinis puniceicyclus]
MAGKAGRSADDAARMPLMEHIRELRSRLIKSALALVVAGIVGFVFYRHIVNILETPICDIKGVHGVGTPNKDCKNGVLVLVGVSAGITLAFKIAMFSGIVLAAPVWMYQMWAFLAPGLYKNEKKYGLTFVGAAIPLFAAGAALCYVFFPTILRVLMGFVPSGVAAQLPLDQTLVFFLRMMVVFGASFVLPLILVLFNFLGVLSGDRMRRHWRVVVLAIFVFAAIAVPTGDPIGMSVLAIPICVLYFGAIGIALANDKRRAARRAADPIHQLSPDEASSLDLNPLPVEHASSLEDIS